MPMVFLVILTVGLSVLGTFGLVYLLRRTRRDTGILIPGTADVEGFYITVIGTLYAILIAFMIFVVWSRYYEATETVDNEADALATVYRLAGGIPEPLKSDIQRSCLDYARVMIRDEWPAMERQENSPRAWAAVNRMWALFNKMGPSNVNDEARRERLLTSFVQLTNLRRARLLQSRTGLPGILYGMIFFGAALTVGFASLFASRSFWAHALKAAVLAALISFMILTVWSLDHPFMGQVHVGPEALQRTLETLKIGR
jgi:hypothetical protein